MDRASAWPIALASKRDELHARPVAALARQDGARVITGRNLRSGVSVLPDADSEPRAHLIRNPLFGTRYSTVVAIARNGAGVTLERRYDADAAVAGETCLPFFWGD